MPSNTLRDSVNGGGERETSGSRGGCTQISPAPFLSTPHSRPIAQKRKRGLEGAPGPGQSMASQSLNSGLPTGLCFLEHWSVSQEHMGLRLLDRMRRDQPPPWLCCPHKPPELSLIQQAPGPGPPPPGSLHHPRRAREAVPKKASPSGCVTVSLGLITVSDGCLAVSITPSYLKNLSSRQCAVLSF